MVEGKVREDLGLTFDDITLLPAASSVLPSEVNLATRFTKKVPMNIPIASAAMDTVTESPMAIALAHQGGIGVIHKNLPIKEQAEEVKKVKQAEYWIIENPSTVSPDTTLEKINELKAAHKYSSFPVVENEKLVGIITSRDLRFETDPNKKVKEMMTKKLVTVDHMVDMEEAKEILHANRIEKLPIVDKRGKLKGLVSVRDVESRTRHPSSNKDGKGRLVVAAAVGPKDMERVKAMVEQEVDAIVVDTAHGHSKNVIECVKEIKSLFDVSVVAGNAATANATEELISAGADAVKVGIGGGAICTTRIISGVGIPQLTAVLDCSQFANEHNIPVISDGGIKYSGDIVKAIAAGASSVMMGSMFAGCEETPGKTVFMNNRKYKQYRGMGSMGAMEKGSKDRYGQAHVIENSKFVPEGIEGVVPYKGTAEEVIYQIVGGIRSGMGYVGAGTIDTLRSNTNMIKISKAALQEGHPHDVLITEESPNYSRQVD